MGEKNVVKCSAGHFFDGDLYTECPHCGAPAETITTTVQSGAKKGKACLFARLIRRYRREDDGGESNPTEDPYPNPISLEPPVPPPDPTPDPAVVDVPRFLRRPVSPPDPTPDPAPKPKNGGGTISIFDDPKKRDEKSGTMYSDPIEKIERVMNELHHVDDALCEACELLARSRQHMSEIDLIDLKDEYYAIAYELDDRLKECYKLSSALTEYLKKATTSYVYAPPDLPTDFIRKLIN